MMPEDILNDVQPEGNTNVAAPVAKADASSALTFAPRLEIPSASAASGALQSSRSLTAAAPSPFAAAAQEPLPPAPDSPPDAAQTAAGSSSSKLSKEQQQQLDQQDSEQQRKQQQAHDGVALLAAAVEVQSPDSQQQQDQDDPAAAAGGDVDMEPEPPIDPAVMADFENALASVMLRPVAVNEANDLRSDLEALTNFDIELVNKSRRGPVGSSSKFRGVTQHRRTRRWEAHIWDSKKQVYLGGFDNEVQAAKAHDVMAIKTRGSKTIINFKVVVYEELLEWLANPQLTKEATVSALRKSSRRISSGKKRCRNSYPLSPTRSPPRTSRNHSSSSSGAAAALQSLANAQLPAAAQTGGSRQHQNALDAALAAAAAAAAGAVDDVGRVRKSGSRGGRFADLLGVTAGAGASESKGSSTERNSYIQVDRSGVVVNMPRSSPALLDLPLPAAAHVSPSISSSISNLGKLGFKGAAASSGLGLSSSMGLSSGLGLSNYGLGLGLNDDDIMLPPSAILEAVLERGSMFDHKFDQALTGFDQGVGSSSMGNGLVGVTTFRGCPGDALGFKGLSGQGLGMLGLDPLGPHGVSRPSSLLLLQQRLQQQHQSMPVPPTAAARQQALLAQQRQQQMEMQQQHQLQLHLQQQQQLQLQMQQQQLQQQRLQFQQLQQQHAARVAQAAAAAAVAPAPTSNLRDITSVHNPNNAFTEAEPATAAARLMNAPEADPLATVASDALLLPSTDVAAASAAAATEEPAGVLVSSGFVGLDFDSSNFSVGSSLPLGAADLIFDPPAASAAAAAAADHQPLYHEPTGSMTANNTADGTSPISGSNNNDNPNAAIAAAAAAAAAEAAAMMEHSRAVQRELAIRREAGLALLMGNRVGKARV